MLVSRNGKQQEFKVVLDALDRDQGAVLASADSEAGGSNALGLSVENISSQQRQDMEGPAGGVMVTKVESDEAWRAGLRPGDVLLMINNREIEDVRGFESIVSDLEAGRAVALRVWRDGSSTFFAYTPRVEDSG